MESIFIAAALVLSVGYLFRRFRAVFFGSSKGKAGCASCCHNPNSSDER